MFVALDPSSFKVATVIFSCMNRVLPPAPVMESSAKAVSPAFEVPITVMVLAEGSRVTFLPFASKEPLFFNSFFTVSSPLSVSVPVLMISRSETAIFLFTVRVPPCTVIFLNLVSPGRPLMEVVPSNIMFPLECTKFPLSVNLCVISMFPSQISFLPKRMFKAYSFTLLGVLFAAFIFVLVPATVTVLPGTPCLKSPTVQVSVPLIVMLLS